MADPNCDALHIFKPGSPVNLTAIDTLLEIVIQASRPGPPNASIAEADHRLTTMFTIAGLDPATSAETFHAGRIVAAGARAEAEGHSSPDFAPEQETEPATLPNAAESPDGRQNPMPSEAEDSTPAASAAADLPEARHEPAKSPPPPLEGLGREADRGRGEGKDPFGIPLDATPNGAGPGHRNRRRPRRPPAHPRPRPHAPERCRQRGRACRGRPAIRAASAGAGSGQRDRR